MITETVPHLTAPTAANGEPARVNERVDALGREVLLRQGAHERDHKHEHETHEASFALVEQRIDAFIREMDQRFASSEKATAVALAEAEKATTVALSAVERATQVALAATDQQSKLHAESHAREHALTEQANQKADKTYDEKFDAGDRFQQKIEQERSDYVRRDVLDTRLTSLATQLNKLEVDARNQMDRLDQQTRARMDHIEGDVRTQVTALNLNTSARTRPLEDQRVATNTILSAIAFVLALIGGVAVLVNFL